MRGREKTSNENDSKNNIHTTCNVFVQPADLESHRLRVRARLSPGLSPTMRCAADSEQQWAVLVWTP
jgi:hypothetical protein